MNLFHWYTVLLMLVRWWHHLPNPAIDLLRITSITTSHREKYWFVITISFLVLPSIEILLLSDTVMLRKYTNADCSLYHYQSINSAMNWVSDYQEVTKQNYKKVSVRISDDDFSIIRNIAQMINNFCIGFFMLFKEQWRNFSFINASIDYFETATTVQIEMHSFCTKERDDFISASVINKERDYFLFECCIPQFFCKICWSYLFRASEGVRPLW